MKARFIKFLEKLKYLYFWCLIVRKTPSIFLKYSNWNLEFNYKTDKNWWKTQVISLPILFIAKSRGRWGRKEREFDGMGLHLERDNFSNFLPFETCLFHINHYMRKTLLILKNCALEHIWWKFEKCGFIQYPLLIEEKTFVWALLYYP